ncbi:MAG: PilZ domain-containing protein [Nitrospirae bacterium]|nr:MAG: PilZ domain-containing protein [Nitrospirota bacterium]
MFVCTHRFATVVGGERARFGVEFDVSLNGAKVMIPASMNMGDQLAISLRLPDQIATMNDDATVRWGHTLGLEFTTLPHFADTRMRKFLSSAPSPQS